METWKILLISLSAALALGLIGGTTIGKIMVKRAKSPRKPILSTKERMIYSACVLLGTALVLFGVFFKFDGPKTAEMSPDGAMSGEQGAIISGDAGTATAAAGAKIARAKPALIAKLG